MWGPEAGGSMNYKMQKAKEDQHGRWRDGVEDPVEDAESTNNSTYDGYYELGSTQYYNTIT